MAVVSCRGSFIGVTIVCIHRRGHHGVCGRTERADVRQTVQQAAKNVRQHQQHDRNPALGAQMGGPVGDQTR